MKKIAIFNSFPFHYEMYGFILEYSRNNGYHVDIYTHVANDFGWLSYYLGIFDNITYIFFNEYPVSNDYFRIFVTTDDDSRFKQEYINPNVICINHTNKIRTYGYKKYLNICNFKDSILDYTLACWNTGITPEQKVKNYVVSIIGSGNNLNVNAINRLSVPEGYQITLNIIGRSTNNTYLINQLDSKFIINHKTNLDTSEMFGILRESSYLLVNYDTCEKQLAGTLLSGSLPLALSTLCKPIVIDKLNEYYQLKESVLFEYSSDSPIILDDIDFVSLESERDYYSTKFDYFINL